MAAWSPATGAHGSGGFVFPTPSPMRSRPGHRARSTPWRRRSSSSLVPLSVVAFPERQKLHEVLWKEQVECPVERDPHLLLEARQLAQIDGAPEPPRYES